MFPIVVFRPEALASSGNFLKMQNPGPHQTYWIWNAEGGAQQPVF